MHIYLEKIINFFLYSNLYIAFCALAMTLQTLYLLNLNYKTSSSLLGLVFFATWLIYALHRLVSLRKVDPALHLQRFTIIRNYQTHIFLYTLFSAFGVGYFLWQLDWMHLKYLVFPGILSFAYILPFLKTKQEKKRLRDIHFVKIFLVSGVWAYVTVALPLIYFDCVWSIDSILYITERALFIFAITLPFDIRDRDLDRSVGVKTIPSALGLEVTLRLAMWILVVWMGLVCYLYPRSTYLAFALSGISTYIFIYFSPRQKQDYYFTALLDGTMFLQVGLLWIIRY